MTVVESVGRVGDKLPDFKLPRLDDGELNFGGLRGKKALLFFWGSW